MRVSDSFLLDSNIMIYVLDQRRPVVDLLHRLDDLEAGERPSISAISVYEVLTGAAAEEQERSVALLAAFEIIPVTEVIAARAASLAQWQREQGAKTAIADTLIAATALALDKTLVTYDRQHFTRLGVTLYQDLPLLD